MHGETIQLLAFMGFMLSSYAWYVENRFTKNKKYIAFCDFSEIISCTKAVGSKYAKIAGLPNSLLGAVAYSSIFIFSTLSAHTAVFYLSIIAVIVSVYLAYSLYFIVKSYCVVCTSIYLVNILLLIFSYLNVWTLH